MDNNTFVDEVYENMDDISKIVEPFEYELNNELAQFPDEIEIDKDIMYSILTHAYSEYSMGMNLHQILRGRASKLNLWKLSRELGNSYTFCTNMFELIVEKQHEDDEMEFDASTGEITGGRMFIRKKKIAVEDNDIEFAMFNHLTTIKNSFNSAREVNKSRLNEIADMFGAKESRKERSWFRKLNRLITHIQSLVQDRKLIIKDFELFKRFVNWIVLYIKDGKLPALANLAKLKIMMRNCAPIYSIKEEPV